MIKRITPTSHFKNNFKLLSRDQKKSALEEIELFREDPANPSLKTHKLKNKFLGYYSFSVLPNLRIIFRFTKPDKSEVLFLDIGSHDIYK